MIKTHWWHLILVCGLVCATAMMGVSVAPTTVTAATATRPIKIMPLGDSITYGTGSPTHSGYRAPLWNRLVDQAGLAIDFVGSRHDGTLPDNANEGHPGWRIDQIAAHVDAWLADYQPDVILLHIGTNDMRQDHLVSTAPQRLGALLDRIHADRPSASIMVAEIIGSTDPTVESRIIAYNAALPGIVASRGSEVHLVDLSALPIKSDLHDFLHPDDAGYAWMATRWYEALEPVIGGGRDWPLFTDGFEPGETPLTWTTAATSKTATSRTTTSKSTASNTAASAVVGTGGVCCGPTTVEATARTGGIAHDGTAALLYSGTDRPAIDGSATQPYAYTKLFAVDVPLTTHSELSYWIYPQQTVGTDAAGTDAAGTHAAVDLQFGDGGDLRDSGAGDQGHLVPNTWNLIRVNLSALAGRTVSRIDIGFDPTAGTGAVRGYLDELSIAEVTGGYPGTNLALHAASAGSTSCSSRETPDRAVDGVTAGNSKWCSGVPGAALEVDLGGVRTVRRFVVKGAAAGGESPIWNVRAYRIALSMDDAKWTTVATVTGNVDAITADTITPTVARFARLTVVQPSQDGSPQTRIYEFEVDGD